eukprot:1199227-Amphidinium_carterae.1
MRAAGGGDAQLWGGGDGGSVRPIDSFLVALWSSCYWPCGHGFCKFILHSLNDHGMGTVVAHGHGTLSSAIRIGYEHRWMGLSQSALAVNVVSS